MSDEATQAKQAFRHHRRTPFSARAEPRVWLMGSAIVICLGLIVFMVVLIVGRGSATFWPRPIDELHLTDGTVLLGVPMGQEPYTPQAEAEAAAVQQARATDTGTVPGAWATDGRPIRRRYMVANRDLGQETFRWIPLWQVESIDRPEDAALVEREEWGPFLGFIEAVVVDRYLEPDAIEAGAATPPSQDVVLTTIQTDGGERIRERTVVASGDEASRRRIVQELDRASDRWAQRDRLNFKVIPGIESQIRALRWRVRKAELEHERAISESSDSLPPGLWLLLVGSAFGAGIGAVRLQRSRVGARTAWTRAAVPACWVVAATLSLAGYLERPGSRPDISSERLSEIQQQADASITELRAKQQLALDELGVLRAEDDLVRLVVREPTGGRMSAISRSESEEPMLLSQMVRIVEANRIGLFGRIGVYFDRWDEFLSQPPRDGAAAGGVFPVIVGTVTLTMLLTVSVVPLGVIAALYLREYARQGLMTSIIRIAINNLAGVPSIVYGMFGLGFFCYILGGYVDSGPQHALQAPAWWLLVLLIGVLVIVGAGVGALTRHSGATDRSKSRRALLAAGLVAWASAVSLAGWAMATTPYFHGFFAEKLPEQPTFGGRGILWASLTLALLTLPVVIVATEEAVAAVPGSMREGSYGCGASKWQTIRRIVLPSAAPGIMTGGILAMARGAGEVAPLMLVGAVNLAPALPVSGEPPFLHGDRTFMHLGFHIYTLGFQSPDSEATQPLVWTTTLLLLFIVLVLNLTAIVLRARIRARMRTAAL